MRWRLTQKHYLMVPGTEYEYKEISQATAKTVRRRFPCPAYLDPDDAGDCNYPTFAKPNDRNELIVAHEGKGLKDDIIFVGDPTPDMVPLDDEAIALSDKLRAKWGIAATLEIGEEGYAHNLVNQLTETLQAFNASAKPSGAVIDDGRFDKLMEMNAALMATVQKLVESPVGRRV